MRRQSLPDGFAKAGNRGNPAIWVYIGALP